MAERLRKLQLNVDLEGEPEEPPEMTAFVFDQGGAPIASAPVKGGKADLALPAETAHHVRILVGPSALGGDEPPSIERLQRAGAHEPAFHLDPEARVIELGAIPEIDWARWRLCRCRVRGRVVRPVSFPSGVRDMPVCRARVHVCEVDQFRSVVWKLPEHVLRNFRDVLLEIPFRPIPEPDPAFVLDPGVVDPSPEAVAAVQPRRIGAGLATLAAGEKPSVGDGPHGLDAQALVAGVGHHGLRAETPLALRAAPSETTTVAEGVLLLDTATRTALASDSMEAVRLAIVDNARLVLPHLCWWPWLWPWFTCDEVAVVETDANGRFDAPVWYSCRGDHPDVYLWVEALVGGTWTTVYRPHLTCNTYWDYECGRELTVRVHDPRVTWCGHVPAPVGSQVVVVSIGWQVGFDEVQPSSAGASEGLTTAGQPFGGSLEPAVVFGSGLAAAGVTHYRWSVRKVGQPESAWRGLDRQVVRHHEAPGGTGVVPFLLGPDVAAPQGPVYKIPPATPPSGVWTPSVDLRENNATAFFPSHLEEGGNAAAAAGKYELKLELFRLTGPPSAPVPERVNLSTEGIDLKFLRGPVPAGSGAAAFADVPPNNRLLDGANVVGFRWVLHVDNNPCERAIDDVMVAANTADHCGFVQYPPGATAAIAFRAFHPNGFATFSFRVARGSSGEVGAASTATSFPMTAPMAGPFANAGGGRFSANVLVSDLLAPIGRHPACAQAAFAETLDVDAMATDGWNRLGHLDGLQGGMETKAFALEPQGP